jgi:hypothetical protein
MPSRKQAGKIVPSNAAQSQAPNQFRNRVVRETFNIVRLNISILGEYTTVKSATQEAVVALFQVIEQAQQEILALTGAPGIIWQRDLEVFCREGDPWCNHTATTPEMFNRSRHFMDSAWRAGWAVEPGKFFMKALQGGGRSIGVNKKRRVHPPRNRRSKLNMATAARPDTPTPDQIQTWFDLPSEPPQPEASQSGS